MEIQISPLGISGNAGFIGSPRCFYVKLGSVATLLGGEQIRVVGQCQINGLIRRFGQVGQWRRRLQIAGLVTDQRDIIFLAANQAGADSFQIALGNLQSGFRLRDVGAGQVADFKPVAGRLQIDRKYADIGPVQFDNRRITDDVHIGRDNIAEHARLGCAKVVLAGFHSGSSGADGVFDGTTGIDRNVYGASGRGLAQRCRETIGTAEKILLIAKIAGRARAAIGFGNGNGFIGCALRCPRAGQGWIGLIGGFQRIAQRVGLYRCSQQRHDSCS